MIAKLSEFGVTSEMAYAAGTASVGIALLSWCVSRKKEEGGTERADRWGIFIGEWAPTFFALGVALRLEEGVK